MDGHKCGYDGTRHHATLNLTRMLNLLALNAHISMCCMFFNFLNVSNWPIASLFRKNPALGKG